MSRVEPVRQHASPEERRQQIIAAASACFAERGFAAATMDDIARAAQLSKGSLYWHFRNKQELFLAVLDAIAAELFEVWEDRAASEPDILELLGSVLTLAGERLRERPDLLPLWLEYLRVPEGRERLAVVYRAARERLSDLIREGITRGQIRDLPPDPLAAALTAGGEGLMLQALVDPDFDLDRHLVTLWNVTRRGIET